MRERIFSVRSGATSNDLAVKVLIAGATGFVGSHLVPALLAAGHEVYALVRNAGAAMHGWDRVQLLEADLAGARLPEMPFADVVVHLAQANVPFPAHAEELLAVNCSSAVALAAHALRCGASRMIYASSGTVYGFSAGLITEAHPLLGAGFYAQTKIAAEKMLSEFRVSLPVDLLRIFTPYGPGQQPARLIPDIVARVREGRPVTVRESGMPSLTPIHVADVVAAIMSRLNATESLTVNVAGGETAGIRDVAKIAGGLLNREAVFELNPASLDGGIAADCRLMTAKTGVRPLSLSEGLSRYVSGR